MERRFSIQIDRLSASFENKLIVPYEIKKHLSDLNLMKAVCSAVFVYIITRLGLGLFGHDLYEIYWWFAAGLAIALFNINVISEKRTEELSCNFE